MKYYIIQESTDLKIVGSFPQSIEAMHNCDVWNDPKFIEHQELVKIDFIPIVSNAILKTRSKLTDLISTSSMGFTRKLLVSGKLKSILESFANLDLQFFDAPIIQKSKYISNYYILYSNKTGVEFIDFKNSTFFLMDGIFDEKEKLVINDYDDFLKHSALIKKQGWPNNIKIKNIKVINKAIDFFALNYVEGGIKYLVSEKLKNEIENAGCTGIEFQPSELSYTEWIALGGEREKLYGKT